MMVVKFRTRVLLLSLTRRNKRGKPMEHRDSLPAKRKLDSKSRIACKLCRRFFEKWLTGCFALFGAALAVAPNAFAQPGRPSQAAKTQARPATLSHDLSGV